MKMSLQQSNNECNNEQFLFNTNILKEIVWNSENSQLNDGISITNPGEFLNIRPLMLDDFHKGYINLLNELTVVGNITEKMFQDRFKAMKNCSNTYYVIVIEDEKCHKIIGSASLIMEQKFIHGTGQRGRLEDVVVLKTYRGKQLGKLLVNVLIMLSKKLGAYKLSLECKPDKIPFYEMFAFKKDEQLFMVQRFPENLD